MRPFLFIAILLVALPMLGAEPRTMLREKTSGIEFSPPVYLQRIIRPLVRRSGQIFAGTVMQVEHHSPLSSSVIATTSVRFRVDQAIRGVRKGQVVEIKEWAGLWQAGERYHPGERVLLFLYPPSRLGFTSPIEHQAGRFPVDSSGRVLIKGGGFERTPVRIRKVITAIREAEAK